MTLLSGVLVVSWGRPWGASHLVVRTLRMASGSLARVVARRALGRGSLYTSCRHSRRETPQNSSFPLSVERSTASDSSIFRGQD